MPGAMQSPKKTFLSETGLFLYNTDEIASIHSFRSVPCQKGHRKKCLECKVIGIQEVLNSGLQAKPFPSLVNMTNHYSKSHYLKVIKFASETSACKLNNQAGVCPLSLCTNWQ